MGWTRLELGIGVFLVAMIALLGPLAALPFSGTDSITLGPPLMRVQTVASILATVPAVVGLIGMIAIFRGIRGSRDEPTRWRYRDH